MSRPVPTPIAAALGVVPAVFGGVRALPGKVVMLPVLAVSSALSTLDATRRGYDDLADRGERLVARLRGTSLDQVEDAVEARLQGTPVAGLSDRAEDALEDAAERAGRALRSVRDATSSPARTARSAGGAAVDAAATAASSVQDAAESAGTTARSAGGEVAAVATDAAGEVADAVPADQAPTGAPTPKADAESAPVRHDTAVSEEVTRTVEAATAGGGPVLSHDELPLPDYDHMTLGSLRGRLRSLDVAQLGQVRTYEKAHADRLPVVTMLDNRIAKLATDAAATPSAGAEGTVPELQPAQTGQGGSTVRPATSSAAPARPRSGDPTNPASAH